MTRRTSHPCGAHREQYYCFKCRTNTCCDTSHPRDRVYYRIRYPAKNVSNYKWKKFIEFIKSRPHWYIELKEKNIIK